MKTTEQLIIFRILQGGFGAPLVPISMAMVLDTFDKSEHGTVSAIYGMGVVFGPIIGPTVGGFLSEELGWRWVFFLLVPFEIIVLLAIISIIDDKSKSGLGLGIFIGKTLLERNGAKVICRNSKTRSGAEVLLTWKNKDLKNL